ncbi:MAG TPA: hypothetical protein ENI57_06010 [Ignavibacteria bacterium]|nr:hypothetical protein [Ignavibacteria bacterium]
MKHKLYRIIISILLVFLFIHPYLISQTLTIGDRIDKGTITNKNLSEISGIAASQVNLNIFWVHNDSGNRNYIYAINNKAKVVGVFELKGIKNRDWEDIAVAPGPKGKSYIYLAEIGDNRAIYKTKYIYRFPEPLLLSKQRNKKRIITKIDKITFQYPDGKRDAETIMVDPVKKDIYIVSKRERKVNVYMLPYPQSLKKIIKPIIVGKINASQIVGGDISRSGNMVIVKNYKEIFFWKKKKNELLKNIFKRKPEKLSYMLEPQGEGICWAPNENGYYTISEKRFGIKSHLYFYPIIKKK